MAIPARAASLKLFVVTYTHPDESGWQDFLTPHIAYLERLANEGALAASGPFVGTGERSAMLLLRAASREAALALIAEDPYMTEGLVGESQVTEWKPIFGPSSAELGDAER